MPGQGLARYGRRIGQLVEQVIAVMDNQGDLHCCTLYRAMGLFVWKGTDGIIDQQISSCCPICLQPSLF